MTALLLIDIQEGFNAPLWGKRSPPRAEENIASLLKAFRLSGRPVIHVQHLSRNPRSPLAPGQPGVEFMSFARPALDDHENGGQLRFRSPARGGRDDRS